MGRIRIKRRHTEEHPEVYATMNGKIRNAIVLFVSDSGGECDFDDYLNFTKSLKTKLKLGYQPKHWHRNNKYVTIVNTENGEKIRLTRLGKNLANIVLR